MSKSDKKLKSIPVLFNAVNTVFEHKIILLPYLSILFLNFLFLEIIYFAPSDPLGIFFRPIIAKIWGANFLQYPYYYAVLPKIFQNFQILMYILGSCLFIGQSLVIISKINRGEQVNAGQCFKEALSRYVHLVVAALILYGCIFGFYKLYGLVYARAEIIRSGSGMFYIIKRVVMDGALYFNLLASVFFTTLFAYTFQEIVISKKKVFAAIGGNLKMVFSSLRSTFGIVFIPSIIIFFMMFVRNSLPPKTFLQDLSIGLLLINIIIMTCVDVIIYTGLTMAYLSRIEQK